MTLPTDHGAYTPVANLTYHPMNTVSNGEAKTVVGKLVKNWKILMHTECNVNLG